MIRLFGIVFVLLSFVTPTRAEDISEGTLTQGITTACTGSGSDLSDDTRNEQCLFALARHREAIEVVLNARYVESYANDMRHRSETWTWHRYSSIAIFVLVFIVVVSGVVMAFMQVRQTGITAISLSDKITISTPVVGVAVLFLSIAFFYLYVTVVYPISVVGTIEKSDGGGKSQNVDLSAVDSQPSESVGSDDSLAPVGDHPNSSGAAAGQK